MVKDRVKLDIGADEPLADWHSIEWKLVEERVRNLRQRIFRAVKNGQWKKARSLMKLMLRSYSNLLLSVRKITQRNRGKKTPGIDRCVVLTPTARVKLVKEMLEVKAWRVQPAVRLYIPKPGTDKRRPLGILTIKNRVAQAVVKNALEPGWEARFEPRSYGFRPGRSVHDAISQCFRRLNRHCTHRWILDADIRSAFDMISHNFIIEKLGKIPAIGIIKQWLRAGYVENEIYNATEYGVQQGGVISPVLANVALDGMEELLGNKYGFIRYADDFVVTARSKEDLVRIKPTIEQWLALRGLALNEEKTRIVSINEGFDFLSFNIRHYRQKCIIKPQKEKVLHFLQSARDWFKINKTATAAEVIEHFNLILSGWAQYYRCVNSKKTFCYVHSQFWKMLWNWCLRRHPKKSKAWVMNRYFESFDGKKWTFYAFVQGASGMTKTFLFDMSRLAIQRHVQVKGASSPDDPDLRDYWKSRKERQHKVLANPGALEYTVRKMLGA